MTNARTRQSDVIDWLNDAYAMERSLEVMLRKQATTRMRTMRSASGPASIWMKRKSTPSG